MKVQNRQQFLIALTIAVAALYIGVNFILTPLAHAWSSRSKQISDLRKQVKDGKFLISRDTFIRGHWAEIQTNALSANTSIAAQQVLRSFDGWSRASGAEITSIAPQWKNDSTNYLTLDCRVEAAGDLNALSKFLYDVERGPMPLRLDSVELGAHDSTGQQLTLALQVNGLALLPNQK